MNQPIKLLLAIPHLGGGGAERVTAQLARHLNPARFEIHLVLVTQDAAGAPALPEWITIHRQDCRRVRNSALKLCRLIHAIQPQIVLSNMAHLNALILLLKPFLPGHTRILIRQNTTASKAAGSVTSRFFYRYLYPRADLILCQSRAMAEDLTQRFGIAAERLAVLHNPVDMPGAIPGFDPSLCNLLTVARLSPEKGIDLLIQALAIVRSAYPEIQLTILGTGPEEAKLRQLAQDLGLGASIHFAGHTDPSESYALSRLFVLASRYEGMPNALLEAAAAGLPIVSTPCSPGLTELLENAQGVWLAAAITAEALAAAIIDASKSLEAQPQVRFQHRFLTPFETSNAIAAYEGLLTRAVRPHIAMVIPTIDRIGGAERQVLLLAKALAARNWRVTLIALAGTGVEHKSSLAAAHVDYLSLDMRKAWIDPRGWFRYLRWARTAKPDILHSHLPHATYFARLVSTISPVLAVVDTIHTSDPGPPSRWRGYRLTHRLAHQVTCVSQAVAETVLARGMAPEVSVLPNGIELPPLSSAKKDSGYFHWIAVGRLVPLKDYPTLLRAVALLDPSGLLTILGSGPEEHSLRELATHLKLDDRVHFAGFQAVVKPWMAKADAFVLSSLWEGLPVSVLEAAAMSLPVVATDGAGTREALIPGQTGLIVPVGDSAALAEAMATVMEMSRSERDAMGTAGRQFVASRYALPLVTDRWEELYKRLLDSKSSLRTRS